MKRSYTDFTACYGMPITIKIEMDIRKAVWKEGKRKRYCRQCLASYVQNLKQTLIDELKGLGAL